MIDDPNLLPFGKRKGEPIADQPTRYLIWCLSNEHLNWRYQDCAEVIVATLAKRFADPAKLLAELIPAERPPQFWKAKQTKARKALIALRQKVTAKQAPPAKDPAPDREAKRAAKSAAWQAARLVAERQMAIDVRAASLKAELARRQAAADAVADLL